MPVHRQGLRIKTDVPETAVDITERVAEAVRGAKIAEGRGSSSRSSTDRARGARP